jgi:hypothetical protein
LSAGKLQLMMHSSAISMNVVLAPTMLRRAPANAVASDGGVLPTAA